MIRFQQEKGARRSGKEMLRDSKQGEGIVLPLKKQYKYIQFLSF